MKRYIVSTLVVVLAITLAVLANGIRNLKGTLTGYEEVPAVSTVASGDFRATINDAANEISYELSYSDLEGTVQQAHIHFGQAGVNGAIEVWLCSNVSSPAPPHPPTQPCPAPPATITGVITPAHVTGQAGGQGIQPGEFDELVRAMRAGKTYVNVHTTKFPGGEVRSQLGPGRSKSEHADH